MPSLAELKERRDELQKKLAEVEKQIDAKRDEEPEPKQVVVKGDQGPDVSSFQGSVDWEKVATKCSFAFAKATEGQSWTDSTFTEKRLVAMGAAALAVGAYHFARPDNNSPEEEVDNFVDYVEGRGGKFISFKDWRAGKAGVLGVLDFEHQPFNATWAADWAAEFESQTGVRPIVYGYGSSLEPIKSALDEFSAVWIAGYPNYVGYSGPQPFLHQYTDRGDCPGISSPCDMNRVIA